MTLRKLAAVAAAALLATPLAACGGDDSSGNDGTSSGPDLGLQKGGTLTVCSDAPYEPFDVINGSGYTGFDGDLVTEIAKGLGVKLNPQDSSFDALESGLALNSNQCDMVSSAMTITDDRAKKIDFSEGYFDSEQSLMVPADSSIAAIGDLAGKKVGVQRGTTGATYAEEHVPDGAKIITLPGDPEMFNALKAGQVDAILQDFPVNYAHTVNAKETGKWKIVEKYDTGEQYGFAFKKGNTKLKDAVNEQLSKLHDNGKYDEIYNKYFKQS